MATALDERTRKVRDRLGDVLFAVVGAGSALVERTRSVVADASPERAKARFDELAARGRSVIGRAEAEGARAVRKTGRTAARTETSRYEDMTVDELQQLAADRGLEGRSGMKKAELVRALKR